ncbi:MAG: DUF6538 domain-containing protein, partial [Planctomycetota bacterium]
DRFLKLRGRRWHYVRRVPKHVADWDARGTIQLSLKTASLEVARIKRDEIEKADDLYWSGVSDGLAAESAEETYRAAKSRALALGFQYLTASQIATTLSIEDVIARIDAAQGTAGQEAPAVLGAHEEPTLTVREAMEFYFDTMAADECRGMSAYQLKSWKKVKRAAAESFVSSVGNKPLLEITRADAQKHYEYWRDRIAGKAGGKPISPDTARRNFGNMRKLFRSYANWLALDVKKPFDGLSFRLRKSDQREVPPFDVRWIERMFLGPGALDHLNREARLIFLILIETGCRPSEVCKLMPQNIQFDHPVPHLAIRFRSDRLVKTEASVREIPLLGVSLEAMKRASSGFPRYRDKETNLSATLIKGLRRRNLLPTTQHTVYSMRHAFEKRMQEA